MNFSTLPVGRSKCPSYIGIEGILLRETQNTLQLISKDNKIRSKDVTYVLSFDNIPLFSLPLSLSLSLSHTHTHTVDSYS